MAASLQGVDVLALTGGIGEHDQELHNELQEALAWLPGLEITVVPANEEQMIARLCQRGQSVEAAALQSAGSDQLRSGKSGV
jgi:acetate kinase